jgi:thiosulfate dehydrogenase [quinone] large subunit
VTSNTAGPVDPETTVAPPVAPGDGTVTTGWALMPLRLFLGVTFLFAGLQKLANPAFFSSSSPISIHAQLEGSAQISPIHGLVSHLVPVASAVGAVIAVGEVAIGVGILVGLWTRVAAIAGMALSFGLFLTVSFHSSPYFTGSDIVFFFAWTPLALAGAAGAPALDTWVRRSSIPAEDAAPAPAGGLPRRDVLSKGALTGLTAAVVVVAAGSTAAFGRTGGGATTSADGEGSLSVGTGATTTSSTPTTGTTGTTATTEDPDPPGTSVGSSTGVPVGGWAAFTDPATGEPALVIQQTAGDFVAFDAVCPHEGCTVAYAQSAKIIACPCHGSEFDAQSGAVIRGPATRGLAPISVVKGSNGDLYVPT